jgi:tRNA G18 (ribose-2'-O)-methylase SpoU
MCRSEHHQGVALNCQSLPVTELASAAQLRVPGRRSTWVYGNRINDPQNLGAMLRSALFLGADGFIIEQGHSCGVTPAVARASAGASELLPVLVSARHDPSLFAELATDFTIISTGVPRSMRKPVRDVRAVARGASENVLLVVGSEGEGVQPHLERLA